MQTSRRNLLSAFGVLGTAPLAGCDGLEQSNNVDTVEVISKSVTITERKCGNANDAEATFSDGRTVARIEGYVPAQRTCDDLSVSVLTTRDRGRYRDIWIDLQTDTEPDAACKPCPETAALAYTGRIEFSTRVERVRIVHLWGDERKLVRVSQP